MPDEIEGIIRRRTTKGGTTTKAQTRTGGTPLTAAVARQKRPAPRTEVTHPIGEPAALAACEPILAALTDAVKTGSAYIRPTGADTAPAAWGAEGVSEAGYRKLLADADGDGWVTALYPRSVTALVGTRCSKATLRTLYTRFLSRVQLSADGVFRIAPAAPVVLTEPKSTTGSTMRPLSQSLQILSEIATAILSGRAHLVDTEKGRADRLAQCGWLDGRTPQGHPVGEVQDGSRVRLWLWQTADLLDAELARVDANRSAVEALTEYLAPFASRIVLSIDPTRVLAFTEPGSQAPKVPAVVAELVGAVNAAMSEGYVALAEPSQTRPLGAVWGVIGQRRTNGTVILDPWMTYLAATGRNDHSVGSVRYGPSGGQSAWDRDATAKAIQSLMDLERYGVALMVTDNGTVEIRGYAG